MTLFIPQPQAFSVSSLFAFLLLVFCALENIHPVKSFSSSGSVHVWRGKIVYYGGSKEMNLHEANTTCMNLGGQLPSVHSHQDILELTSVIGQEARLWLGAKPNYLGDPTAVRGNYEWADGTPFDYNDGWVRSYPNCVHPCCGVGFTTVYEDGLLDKDCSIHRRLICMLPIMTNATAQAWLSSQMDELTSHLNISTALDFEQQLALEILNETLFNLQENTDLIASNFTKLTKLFHDELGTLNLSITTNERTLSELFTNVKESLSLKANEASLKSEHNQSELSSLSTRINICFALLSFIAVAILITLIVKSNILSWVPSLGKSNIYTRFREPRNLRSTSFRTTLSASSNNFANNAATDSNLNLDSYYSQPIEPQDRV